MLVIKEEVTMLAITAKAKQAILKNGGEVVEERHFVKLPVDARSIDNIVKGGWGKFSCQTWELADGSQVVYSSDEGYTLGRKAQI
jgi:hypothetical protein